MKSPNGLISGVPERVSISCHTCGTHHDSLNNWKIAHNVRKEPEGGEAIRPYTHQVQLLAPSRQCLEQSSRSSSTSTIADILQGEIEVPAFRTRGIIHPSNQASK